MRRAEIDTSAPFRSVKEAVMLFGERVLATQVYANKLKEMQNEAKENDNMISIQENNTEENETSSELEETKQSLVKAREDGLIMATCLTSLQEELERTKRELEQLKEQDYSNSKKQEMIHMEPVVDHEDLKYVEDSTRFQVVNEETSTYNDKEKMVEFLKKRYVTFANPPSLAQVIVPRGDEYAVLERHPSLRKKKKKPLIPLIGGIFSRKKKGSSQVESTRAR